MDTTSVAGRLRAIQLPPGRSVQPAPTMLVLEPQKPSVVEELPAGKRQLLEPIDLAVLMHQPEKRQRSRRRRRPDERDDWMTNEARTDREMRIEIAAGITAARDSLPLRFLYQHGLHGELLRRTFRRVFVLRDKVLRACVLRAWKMWFAQYNQCLLREFLQRTLKGNKHQAATILWHVFSDVFHTRMLRRGFIKWRRTTKRIRFAIRRRCRDDAAAKLQRWAQCRNQV